MEETRFNQIKEVEKSTNHHKKEEEKKEFKQPANISAKPLEKSFKNTGKALIASGYILLNRPGDCLYLD